MDDNRKTAKRLLLINWSCFQNEIISLGSSTLFTGVNGTGKTTILDAMNYLITANTQFNKAADDNARNVTAYIHGDRKTNGSDRYLRPGNVTSYIAMEFFDPRKKVYIVIAVCIESRSETDGSESKWIIKENARFEDFNFSIVENHELTVTSRNNLEFKKESLKATDFFGRDKAILQLTRQLGIRTSIPDCKKYKEKLLKMMAFDPERNVDKFLQTSVFADAEVKSLTQLREQRKLFEQAKQMYENTQKRKTFLLQIEDKIASYEKARRNYTIRELMYRYQYVNSDQKDIEKLELQSKNVLIELTQLEIQRKENERTLEQMRKRLSEVENKNHSITDSLNKLEEDKQNISRTINYLETQLASLKQLQISLKILIEQISEYISISDTNRNILCNVSEKDFSSAEKRITFLDFAEKVNRQKELLIEDNGRIKDNLSSVNGKLTQVEQTIKDLESNIRQFPQEALDAKNIIKNEFEKRGIKSEVRLFAELVQSLTDESWRKSIETFLGNKRFHIIVEDEHCHTALKILSEKNLYKANVVLTDKIPNSDIADDSASTILSIVNKGARKYANYLLNGIHLCKDLEELHEYPKGGLMKDGMLCKSYSASKMRIQDTKLYLGNDVVKIQLEQARKEKTDLLLKKTSFEKKIEAHNQLKRLIENIKWNAEDYNFDSATELFQNQHRLGEVANQINELKNSPEMLASMKEIEIAQNNLKESDEKARKNNQQLGAIENEQKNILDKISSLTKNLDEEKNRYNELTEKNPELVSEMLTEYKKQVKQRNNNIIISDKYLKQLSVDTENAKKQMENTQREYNQLSEIDLTNVGIEFIGYYRDEYRTVINVKIDEAKEKLDQSSKKLRDVFLHDFVAELNENITKAKEEIEAINSELKRIPFGRDVYQFKMIPKADRQVFFTICDNLEQYSESPDLFTEKTVDDERLAEDVQNFLNKILDTEQEEDYSDYRNYFSYDMKIHSKNGNEESEMDLSKKQGSASGGEKQTPYFIVLAASLLQFYPKDICCARIAFIDEAFSALSKERIEQMVKFLEDNNFQVFYAAPPEKINSIGQHIDNTVSLFTQGKYTKPVEGFVNRK